MKSTTSNQSSKIVQFSRANVSLIQWMRYFGHEVTIYAHHGVKITDDFIFSIYEIKHFQTQTIVYKEERKTVLNANGKPLTQMQIKKKQSEKIRNQMLAMINILEKRMKWKITIESLSISHHEEGLVDFPVPVKIVTNEEEIDFDFFMRQFFSFEDMETEQYFQNRMPQGELSTDQKKIRLFPTPLKRFPL